MGLKRGVNPRSSDIWKAPRGRGWSVLAGISACEKYSVPKTLVQEVAAGKTGVRVFGYTVKSAWNTSAANGKRRC